MNNRKHKDKSNKTKHIGRGREWDELNRVSVGTAQAIKATSNQLKVINAVISKPEIQEKVLTPEQYNKAKKDVEVLARDLLELGGEFSALRETHSDKRGRCNSDNQIAEILSIGLGYDELSKKVIGIATTALTDIQVELDNALANPEVKEIVDGIRIFKEELTGKK